MIKLHQLYKDYQYKLGQTQVYAITEILVSREFNHKYIWHRVGFVLQQVILT